MNKTIPELLEGCEERFIIYVRDSCINELKNRKTKKLSLQKDNKHL